MGNKKIEENKELVEKLENELVYYKETAQFDKAVEICERLVYEFDYFGYRFDLPELYNKAGLYNKTIGYVNSWMADSEINDTLSFDARPILCIGDAYFKQGSNDSAIRNYSVLIQTTLYEINQFPNASDINDKRFWIAIAESKIGKVYYSQSNYSEANKHFKEALNYSMFIDALYYIAHMCYFGEGFDKDVDMAIVGYEKIVDCNVLGKKPHYNDSDHCIVNANYELGMIYATESSYIDKQQAEKYLKKANKLGYSISEEEIDELLSKINEINNVPLKTKNNSYSSGGCYVATCVYGSYDCPEVWTLRRFRDNVLSKNLFGRLFIKCYYAISPTTVEIFGDYLWFHKLFKAPLDKWVEKLNNRGVDNTPYKDR